MQPLTVLTPGASNAQCSVYIDGLRYKFRPPQTISIPKSKENLVVDCLAPGNRHKKTYIEAEIEKSFYGNVATGIIPGAAWDYTSNAMFKYPDTVEVNFENTPVRSENLPAHNNPDIRQPEDYMLEEFRPGTPRLNSDRYNAPTEIQHRERGGSIDSSFTSGHRSETDPQAAMPAMDKGDLMNVIDNLGSSNIDPAGPPAPESSSAAEEYGPPVPLYPGQ